jgi:hypothetical protein
MPTPERSKPHVLSKFVYNTLKGDKETLFMPPLGVLDKLFECLYYASMQSEEGQLIQVTVAFFNPFESRKPLARSSRPIEESRYIALDEEIPLTIKTLVKVSKAADPWSSSLAVYYDEDEQLFIYGMLDQAIHSQSFVNYELDTRPELAGYFQAAIQGIGVISVTQKYKLLATLRQNKLVTQFLNVWDFGPISDLLLEKNDAFAEEIRKYMRINFPREKFADWEGRIFRIWTDTLCRILIQIRNYHHGGAILITDNFDGLTVKYPLSYNRLRGAMLRFMRYRIAYEITMRKIPDDDGDVERDIFDRLETYRRKKFEAANELKGAIRFIASHSCVDGLILLDNDMIARGFGTVIDEIQPPAKVYSSPTAGYRESNLKDKAPNEFGTRHQSMISFCWHHAGAIGIVLSQDGEIRVMTKFDKKLIMWENVKTQRYIKGRTNIFHDLEVVENTD